MISSENSGRQVMPAFMVPGLFSASEKMLSTPSGADTKTNSKLNAMIIPAGIMVPIIFQKRFAERNHFSKCKSKAIRIIPR
jgi:hypothetical protein